MDRSKVMHFTLHVGIVATVVFVMLYAAMFTLPFTGNLIFEKNVSVSVQEQQDTEISQFGFDQRIEIGESANVSLELTNRGSVPVSSTYDLEVYDINNTLLYSYPGPSKTLQPGVFMKRVIKHTPHESGVYILRLRAVMGGNTLQTARFLLVSEPPKPDQDPDPIIITRKNVRYVYGPEPPEYVPPTRSWRVEAPRTIDLEQGTTTTVPIRITNTGEAMIQHVQLMLRSSQNISVSFEPKILFSISPGTTRNFLVEVTSDENLREDQELSYTVKSRKLSQSGETDINIVPTTTLAQLRKDVEKLRLLISDAEQEMEELRAEGFDVTDIETDLTDTKELVSDAETSIDEEDIDAAKQHIGQARSKIGDAFQKLFKEQSEQLIVTAPLVKPVYLLIGASILIAILMVGGYYYLKEKHHDRPKLLRDLEEKQAV